MIRFIQLICLFLLTNYSVVMADTLDVAKINQSSISLTTHLGILEDAGKSLTLEDVQKDGIQFKTDLPESESINKSFTKSAFWLRFDIENSSDSQIEKIIEIDYPLLWYVDFYFQSDYKNYQIHTGYGRPYENRVFKSQIFAFPLQLQAHSQNTIYIRIEELRNSIDIPARLWNAEDFYQKERSLYAFQALYFGIVICVSIFSIALAKIVKDKAYLMYLGMVLFVALTVLALRGLGSEFIWKNYPFLTQYGTISFGALATAFQLLFLQQVFNKVIVRLNFDLIVKGLIISLLLIPFIVILDLTLTKYCLYILVISLSFAIIVSAIGIKRKERSANFLFAGFCVQSIGASIKILSMFALFPTNFITANSLAISSSIEMLIFTMLLTDRYHYIHLDKLQSDKDLAEINIKLIAEIEEHKKSQLRKMEVKNQLNQLQRLESIGRLTSGIAHDFNNILFSIIGYNQLNSYAGEDCTDEKLKEEILFNTEQVNLASERAVNLIKKMMAYSRQNPTVFF